MRKHKVEIDADTADRITLCTLKDSIELTKKNIKQLNKKKDLRNHEKEDLFDAINTLQALMVVYDYYGGNIK